MSADSGSVPMVDPLAYFLTWTTYGSWLPGDDRGWMEKPGQFRSPSPFRMSEARQAMAETEFTLSWPERQLVEDTIRNHCKLRGWELHAVNCRTQHVHVVVTAPNHHPKDVLNQLKAWCTRRLKERQIDVLTATQEVRKNWWTQGGSKRRIYSRSSLDEVIWYALEGQGEE
jgi:REP element-mobilizing transposase RayT